MVSASSMQCLLLEPQAQIKIHKVCNYMETPSQYQSSSQELIKFIKTGMHDLMEIVRLYVQGQYQSDESLVICLKILPLPQRDVRIVSDWLKAIYVYKMMREVPAHKIGYESNYQCINKQASILLPKTQDYEMSYGHYKRSIGKNCAQRVTSKGPCVPRSKEYRLFMVPNRRKELKMNEELFKPTKSTILAKHTNSIILVHWPMILITSTRIVRSVQGNFIMGGLLINTLMFDTNIHKKDILPNKMERGKVSMNRTTHIIGLLVKWSKNFLSHSLEISPHTLNLVTSNVEDKIIS